MKKLTEGSEIQQYHAHSYYDINVFDDSSRYVVGYENNFVEREIRTDDCIEIGIVDSDSHEPNWRAVGYSAAWSWQQGPMAQFIPGTRCVIWNDRDETQLCSRVLDIDTGESTKLPLPSYAVSPCGTHSLSLDFDRLDQLRPGYGYASSNGRKRLRSVPSDQGIWRMNLTNGKTEMIVSIREAALFLIRHLGTKFLAKSILRQYRFWFNHIKFSPSGAKFTVKLRYRARDSRQGWWDGMGVSLVMDQDGANMRVLSDATSHVIWQDDDSLYFWRRTGLYVYRDTQTGGELVEQIGPDLIQQNVHARHFAGRPETLIFDTPYQEDVDLKLLHRPSGQVTELAKFTGHLPVRGPFRCDLHPVPSPDGRKILVTSLQDGGRQMYLLEMDTKLLP